MLYYTGLADDMYEDGYKDIRNIDYSPKAIEIMSARNQDKPGLTCLFYSYFPQKITLLKYPLFSLILLLVDEVKDVLSLQSEPEGAYDAVIDKGTLDSLLCGDGSFQNVQKMITGIYQYELIAFFYFLFINCFFNSSFSVLKPGGVFIEISYGSTDNRVPYIQLPELYVLFSISCLKFNVSFII